MDDTHCGSGASAASGVRPLYLAHRGDWRNATENTLPALLAAVRVPGCDGVEFDVRIARDGTPVVLHDATLDRVQRQPERASALTPAELAALGVPTLADVLDRLPRTAFLNIELKDRPTDAVIDVIDAAGRGTRERTLISSFRPATLAHVRRARPYWSAWLNADDGCHDTLSRAVRLGCDGVSVAWASLTAETPGMARAAGLRIATWTVQRPATRAALLRLPLHAVCVEQEALTT